MIHIVTDSTSDIDRKEAESIGLHIVSLSVLFGTKSYRDGIDLTAKDFYEKLVTSEELPTTSQINPGEFEEVFRSLLKNKDDEIIGIFISSELSGTYQSAVIAKESVDPNRIHVIDSRSVTFALALLVYQAIEMRDQKKSPEEIVNTIESLIPKVHLYAIVDTLKYLKMGGRISATTAAIGSVLGINPLVSVVDGKVESVGKVRGRKAGLKWIHQQMEKMPPDLSKPISFGHSNANDSLMESKVYFREKYDIKTSFDGNIGAVVGTHAGPGAVGIAYISKD